MVNFGYRSTYQQTGLKSELLKVQYSDPHFTVFWLLYSLTLAKLVNQKSDIPLNPSDNFQIFKNVVQFFPTF